MKKTIISVAVLLTSLATAFGQLEGGSYNPYLVQPMVTPAPMLPAEFNGTGTLAFDVGNTGSSDIVRVAGDEMLLTITLSYGVPDNVDPTAAVGGPGAAWFSWLYFPHQRTLRGTQIATIPGDSRKTIEIAYKVVENSFKGQSYKNGYNVNISPPAYTGGQTTDDDAVAIFTYVRAYDFGDAPLSYGEAQHTIDTKRDGSASPGPYYNNFFWLGAHIDADTNHNASADAKGDDNNTANGLNGISQNDEDGVVFPAMISGTTVEIPVSWTFAEGSKPVNSQRTWAYLSAWIDWNGDGVFDDSEGSTEVVSHTWEYNTDDEEDAWAYRQRRRTTGVSNLSVAIPADAVVDRPIYARFRVSTSEKITPNEIALNGEVEDYQITIKLAPITIGDRVWLDDNGNGVLDAGESGVSNVVVRLFDASIRSSVEITQTVTSVDGSYQFTDLPPGRYQVAVEPPAGYAFTVQNTAAGLPVSGVAQDGLSAEIDVTEGGTHLTMYAGIYLPAALHGSLFMDKDGNALLSEGDLPITNTTVTLTVNGVAVASTNSNVEGYYYFADVPPGAVTLLVSRAEATLVGVPAGEDPTRNRALPMPDAPTAFINYNITSGYGVLEALPGEPLNFGFAVHPLSTQLDLRVYAAADGRVMIEVSTVNENGRHAIEIYAMIDGSWKSVATVPSEQVVGFGSNTYTVEAFGLVPGASYRFKIVDESGHIFESGLIEVARSLLAVEAMTLMPEMVKVVFRTKPGMAYQVMVCEALGMPWKVEYVQRKTARGYSALTNEPFFAGRGETTEVLVPRNQRAAAFFKIIQIQ
ncbi:MAG: SdrD B-like domain-containing protein [Kiritimatiellae bacterium]|nr:SdrD B-like domain-containing protein [Kiritimatiellia bacterium]